MIIRKRSNPTTTTTKDGKKFTQFNVRWFSSNPPTEKQYRHESRLVAFGNFPHSIGAWTKRERERKKTSFYTKFNFKCAFRIANANCTSATTNLRRNVRIMSVALPGVENGKSNCCRAEPSGERLKHREGERLRDTAHKRLSTKHNNKEKAFTSVFFSFWMKHAYQRNIYNLARFVFAMSQSGGNTVGSIFFKQICYDIKLEWISSSSGCFSLSLCVWLSLSFSVDLI